ncbi:MAG: hypothetical protein ALECFALPRED_000638 [Alectoria fallacina]|uniref:Uncharacterized protein n=1 Tax=Alectoria fallacina TaxID=1903189 RepID=A0A8H3F2X3_9LECA|nr:MAG: hypothetical protein ALECFALPRED_000638 [Alectoria fallacina]
MNHVAKEAGTPIEAREVLYIKPSAEKVKDQVEAEDAIPIEARAKVVYPTRSAVEDRVEAEDAITT